MDTTQMDGSIRLNVKAAISAFFDISTVIRNNDETREICAAFRVIGGHKPLAFGGALKNP